MPSGISAHHTACDLIQEEIDSLGVTITNISGRFDSNDTRDTEGHARRSLMYLLDLLRSHVHMRRNHLMEIACKYRCMLDKAESESDEDYALGFLILGSKDRRLIDDFVADHLSLLWPELRTLSPNCLLFSSNFCPEHIRTDIIADQSKYPEILPYNRACYYDFSVRSLLNLFRVERDREYGQLGMLFVDRIEALKCGNREASGNWS